MHWIRDLDRRSKLQTRPAARVDIVDGDDHTTIALRLELELNAIDRLQQFPGLDDHLSRDPS